MYSASIMSDVNAKEQLAKAQKELSELLLKREHIEILIAKQKRKVAAWVELCDESDVAEPVDLDLGGLSDACRTALRGSRKEWITIAEIQAALKELGFPLQQYKAPAASITTTVNRMVEEGSVVPHKLADGVAEYKWVGPKDLRGVAGIPQIIDEMVRHRRVIKKI